MERVLRLPKRKKNLRWLLAAIFLLIMFVEHGSHVLHGAEDPQFAKAWTWCEITHHTNPSADCPHKRHPGSPQKNVLDDVTHHWATLGEVTLPETGFLYDSGPNFSYDVCSSSRSLEPPFQPPKHA